MTQPAMCLENESELKKLAQNNDLFERKNYNFERQRDEMDRAMQIFEACSSHVKRMVVVARDNKRNLKEDVETSQRVAKAFFKESTDFVDASFEKVGAIRTNDHVVNLQRNPNLSISLPYDEYTESLVKTHQKLEKQMEEVAGTDALLSQEQETLKNSEEVIAKAVGKAEKEVSSLKQELEVKKEEIARVKVTSSVNQQKLLASREENLKKEQEMVKLKEESGKLEEVLKALKEKSDAKQASLKAVKTEATMMETIFQSLEFDESFDRSILLKDFSSGNQNLQNLAKQLHDLLSTQSSPIPDDVDASEVDTIDILKSSLENVQSQKKLMQNNVEQVGIYKKKHDIASGNLKGKREELEKLQKSVSKNTEILNNLKVIENSAKPLKRKSKEEDVLRRLQAAANDLPGPTFNSEAFTPPRGSQKNPVVPQNGKIKIVARSSIESDSTRPMNSNSFPGIQLIDPPKKRLSEEEHGSDDVTQEEESFMDTDETGTTQNASMMNQMFSPLRNKSTRQEEPVETPNFSMMQHYQKFETRQRAAKKAQNYADDEVEEEEEEDVDSSLYAPPMEGADSENDGSDASDDLNAPDDILDQSNWGSDD